MATGEFDLIRRFRDLLPEQPGDLVIGPGDDCAAFDAGDGRLWLMTCDALVEGRHFRLDRTDPETLGRRLATVNLSDIAAMGGSPRFALVSLVLPDDFPEKHAERLVRGAVSELGKYGACIAGGNLSGGDALVADMTLVGEVAGGDVLRRNGACTGDSILVTGRPGSAAAGLALLELDGGEPRFDPLICAFQEPRARVEVGRAIAALGMVTAMIDISDGLMADLGHLCAASGVGAELRCGSFDLSGVLKEAAERVGVDPLQWVLSGGEDYELLFTTPPGSADRLVETGERAGRCPVTVIGTVTGSGIRCLDDAGDPVNTKYHGWDHFRRDDRRPSS